MWLIAVGVVLLWIVFYYWSEGHPLIPRPIEPSSSPAKFLYFFSALLLGSAFFLFYTTDEYWNWNQWKGFSVFVISVALFIFGVWLLKSAYKAHQKFALDMDAMSRAHRSILDMEHSRARSEVVRDEVFSDALVRKMQKEVEMLRIQVEKRMLPIEAQSRALRSLIEQREMQLRESFVEPARRQGMSVDQYMAVNEHWNRQMIDLEMKWQQIQQTLALALETHDEVVQARVNNKLLEMGQDLVGAHARVFYGNLPETTKRPLLALYRPYLRDLWRNLYELGVVGEEQVEAVERNTSEDAYHRYSASQKAQTSKV
jgi:hypothetical protein